MQKPHRVIQTSKSKPRKFNGKCESCGMSICSCKAYQYTDESNAAISNSSPWLCKDCYERIHGAHIKTEVEGYRDRLIDTAIRLSHQGYEFKTVDDVIKLIQTIK